MLICDFLQYLPENLLQKPLICKAIGGDRLLLENMEVIKVDSLILFDSEEYDFSFLSNECQIQNREKFRNEIPWNSEKFRLTPLYKQMIHIEFPRSLFFVGIPTSVCKGIFFSIQAEFILRILFGLIRLPLRDSVEI